MRHLVIVVAHLAVRMALAVIPLRPCAPIFFLNLGTPSLVTAVNVRTTDGSVDLSGAVPLTGGERTCDQTRMESRWRSGGRQSS
jgi:hypothetical protein